jgi:hypothetical protein
LPDYLDVIEYESGFGVEQLEDFHLHVRPHFSYLADQGAIEPGRQYPVCLDFAGDFPVKYWSEEDPEEPEPFSIAEVNRTLAKSVDVS